MLRHSTSPSEMPEEPRLPFRRIGVISMRVAFADTAVPAVDEQFAVLIPSDLTRGINGLPLGPVDRSGTLTTGSADGPSAVVRNNVLIAFCHVNLLIQKVFLLDHPCLRQR